MAMARAVAAVKDRRRRRFGSSRHRPSQRPAITQPDQAAVATGAGGQAGALMLSAQRRIDLLEGFEHTVEIGLGDPDPAIGDDQRELPPGIAPRRQLDGPAAMRETTSGRFTVTALAIGLIYPLPVPSDALIGMR
jgi:hypothetical protein